MEFKVDSPKNVETKISRKEHMEESAISQAAKSKSSYCCAHGFWSVALCAKMFQLLTTHYSLLTAFYCSDSKLHPIIVVSRQAVCVEVCVHKFDIKYMLRMCLLDKWVCSAVCLRMCACAIYLVSRLGLPRFHTMGMFLNHHSEQKNTAGSCDVLSE